MKRFTVKKKASALQFDLMVVKNCLRKAGVKKNQIESFNYEISSGYEDTCGCIGFGYSGFGVMKVLVSPTRVHVSNTLPNGSSETFTKLCVNLLKSFGNNKEITASWSDMFGADNYSTEKIIEWSKES